MREYVITTDATADLPAGWLENSGVEVVAMPYVMGDTEYGISKKQTYEDFYSAMKAGAMPTTSQASLESAEDIFSKYADEGKDILHISFSSGMSGSFSGVSLVAKQTEQKYGVTVKVIDSLSGAGGEGLLVYYASKLKKEGKTLEETAEWIENNKLYVNHLFVVEDLAHLRRGGRVSRIEALLGGILGIKPVLKLSDEGRIVPVAKARGMRRAVENMIEAAESSFTPDKNDFILVSHGHNEEAAKLLGQTLFSKFGVRVEYSYVSYLVGAHAGPGCLAVFFMGKNKGR